MRNCPEGELFKIGLIGLCPAHLAAFGIPAPVIQAVRNGARISLDMSAKVEVGPNPAGDVKP